MNNQIKKIKTYTYFFKDGGWNTASGVSRRDAYKNARNEWLKQQDPKLADQVDKDSFHIASKEEEEKLLGNFW